MLTADELNAMRLTLKESLHDTAQIQPKTLVSDGAGGFTESWSTVANETCLASPSGLSPQERVIAEKLTATRVWAVTLPALADVEPTDRIIVGTWAFEVVAVMERSNEISRRVICTEVV